MGASKYDRGSILYNYSTSVTPSSADCFPLEPNAGPWVILGLYDASTVASEQENINEDGIDHLATVIAAHKKLRQSFESSQFEIVYKVVVVDASYAVSNEDVVNVSTDQPDTFREAMQTVSLSVVNNVGFFAARLADVELTDPRPSVPSKPVEGDRGKADTIAADRTPDPQSEPASSEATRLPSKVSILNALIIFHASKY